MRTNNISSRASEHSTDMNKAIIFDMDGTLFQTNKILEISLMDTFQHLNLLQEWEGKTLLNQFQEIMGAPLPKVWKTLMPTASSELIESVNCYFLETLVSNIRNGKGALYPHVTEMLSELKKRGYALFIASNGLIDYLEAIVTYYRLDRWITETFSIEQIDSLNKADLVKAIVTKYNLQQGAVVGDRISDIHAARSNELIAIGCNFDFAKPEELAQADIVIQDFMELQSHLKNRAV